MRRSPNSRVAEIGSTPWSAGAETLSPAQVRLFESLYRRHFDFVFRNLRRAGVHDALVDDAVQDVFIVVLRRLSDFRQGSSPKPWLFAILARVASNYRRREQRKGGLGPIPDDHPAGGGGPFERVAHASDLRLLHRFLGQLPEGKRDVFVMADLEQMTAPEIAEALGINANTVYSRLHAVRERLAAYLVEQRPQEAR